MYRTTVRATHDQPLRRDLPQMSMQAFYDLCRVPIIQFTPVEAAILRILGIHSASTVCRKVRASAALSLLMSMFEGSDMVCLLDFER